MAKVYQFPYHKRRLLDAANPDGYLESDIDYVRNNLDLAVSLLDKEGSARRTQRANRTLNNRVRRALQAERGQQ